MFILDVYGDIKNFVQSFNVIPKYGYADEDHVYGDKISDEEIYENVCYSLYEKSNIVVINKKLNSKKTPDSWYIETDSSIEIIHDRDNNKIPAEIISSVYQIKSGLDILNRFFDWMKENGHITNQSTGLHVTVSIDGKNNNDYDYLKMILFFDENYTANLFNRLGNKFAIQIRDKIKNVIPNFDNVGFRNITQNKTINEITAFLKNKFRSVLDITFKKYFSINNRGNGLFEFRGMGGINYEYKFDIIYKQVVNFANILKIGSDDKLYAKEYLVKFYSLLEESKFANSEIDSDNKKLKKYT